MTSCAAGLALMLIGFAQGFRSAVPCLVAGCVSGCAIKYHCVHGIGRQGCRIRRCCGCSSALPFYRDDWRPIIWVLAVLSLVIGSLLAVVQTDVKRMLAFFGKSCRFHSRWPEATGLSAGETQCFPRCSRWRCISALLGARRRLICGQCRRGGGTTLDGFNGLSSRRPTLALALTVFLLAQAGVPFTSGFVAKWGVIQSAVDAGSYWLAVIAILRRSLQHSSISASW